VFSGDIEAENLTTFKYIAVDPETKKTIETEVFERTYSENDKKNDVFNR